MATTKQATSDATLSRLQQAIRQRVGDARYQLWFAPHTRFSCAADRLTVGVPNLHFQDWLNKTFGESVREAVAEVYGRPMEVAFVIDAQLFRAARAAEARANEQVPATPPPAPPAPAALPPKRRSRSAHSEPIDPVSLGTSSSTRTASTGTSSSTRTASTGTSSSTELFASPTGGEGQRAGRGIKHARRWRLLSQFVVGPCNRVAYASALSVVEQPGEHANPLVLHGPVGTGKTHLLEGIYAGLRKNFPEAKVCWITAEDFTNRFVQAARFGKLSSFRRAFREYDALLLDDLHFLAKKPATQEEFLHTFDALLLDGKQVVVTCDCHPRLSEELLPELLDRLLGGAIWGLTPPDAQTRLDLLRAKSAGGSPALPEDVLQLLAQTLRGNVRELEGAIHSLRHYARVTGQPVDMRLAQQALGELLRHAVRVVQIVDVERAVVTTLRLPPNALREKSRAWAVTRPRTLAIYLCRKHTNASYSAISDYFGIKSHSAAVAAEKKVRQWLQEGQSLTLGERDWPIRDLLERIERDLHR